MTRILIAPDKFKGSLTAAEVGNAIAAGLRTRAPAWSLQVFPVADGGDGTVRVLADHGWESVSVRVKDAAGRPHQAQYARRGQVAVIEQASTVGLAHLVGTPDPMRTSTYGMGEAVANALRDPDIATIVLSLGGSASSDGGAGMLQALGARLSDASGAPVGPGPAGLLELVSVDLSALQAFGDRKFVVLCDVNHPLLGSDGAAAVFAPQKGATPAQVRDIERGLSRWSVILGNSSAQKDAQFRAGAGAGGGTAYGAIAALLADIRPGVEWLFDATGFEKTLASADLVITGEGCIDEQTLRGKAPIGILNMARRHGLDVIGFAGRCDLTPNQVRSAGFRQVYTLAEIESDSARSIANAETLLAEAASRCAEDLERGATRGLGGSDGDTAQLEQRLGYGR